jgi:hypothetical protein
LTDRKRRVAATFSFQEHFHEGHEEAAHNNVGLKIIRQSRTLTKTKQINGRDVLFSFQLLLWSCKLLLL